MAGSIGVPTVSKGKKVLTHGLYGAVGGALIGLSNKMFGNGIVGAGVGLLGCSMLPETEAGTLAVVLGKEIGQGLFAGSTAAAPAANSQATAQYY